MTMGNEEGKGMEIVLTLIAVAGSVYLAPLAIKLLWNTFLCAVAQVHAITWVQALMMGVLAHCLVRNDGKAHKDRPWSEVRNEAWAKLIAWGFTIGMWAVLK